MSMQKLNRFILIILFISLLFLSIACVINPSKVPVYTNTYYFHAQKADGSGRWQKIKAIKQWDEEDSSCLIYVQETQLSTITADFIRDIANEFDQVIYPRLTSQMGGIYDIDRNGKVVLLFMDIVDDYSPGSNNGYVAGYFHSVHMTNHPKSNRADMLFIDTNPQLNSLSPTTVDNVSKTIAHELQHLITFCATRIYSTPSYQLDTWINEGLSLGVEFIYSETYDERRIKYFNTNPASQGGSKTTIYLGNNFFVWEGPEDDVLADYATAYLFFQWLRIQNGGDASIYQNIMNSGKRNYEAVTSQFTEENAGFNNWETLLSTWMLANALYEDSGIYGYEKELELKPVIYAIGSMNDNAALSLLPGEGVFSVMNGIPFNEAEYRAGSGPNIRFREVGQSTKLLTFNSNRKHTGSAEYGMLGCQGTGSTRALNAAPSIGSLLATGEGVPYSEPTGPYPIDYRMDDSQ